MNKTTEENGRFLAKAKEEQEIKLGMDVHAGQITVCRQEGGLLPQPAQKMSWERCLEWIQRQVQSGAKIYSCYEAGPCGYGLHRSLSAMGVANVVVAPQRWDERGRRVKTDRRDARELVDHLDRYLRGNSKVFGVVRVPTEEQERRRMVTRQRGRVLKERNRCVLRGHGILLCQGYRASAGWWRPHLWRSYSATLPDWLREQVGYWQMKALSFQGELAVMDRRVEQLTAGKKIPKGLGSLTAELLGAEILDWSRFKNRRQVASYTGLCPSENSTGERRKQGAISRCGNPRVRYCLVEAVWRLERYQPAYPPLKKLREANGARSRKRMAVAVARRLAVDLWRIETGQCSAQKLGLELVRATKA
jgi:transposase